MVREERRKHQRTDSLNLLSYHCLDENDDIVMQGVGRTLNFSQGGILLETHTPIDLKTLVSLFIAMEDDLVDVKGSVIHASAIGNGKFNTGIAFVETDEATREVIEKYADTFQGKQ
jgi:hypothetical protein